MSKLLFYIGERINPQLKQSYYNDYGQLTTKVAKIKSDCAYGSIILTSYNSKEDYELAKVKLVESGFKVNNLSKS